VVSKWDGGGNASYALEIDAAHLRVEVHDGVDPTQTVFSHGFLVDSAWQHIAATLSNHTLRLYINGVLDTTFANSQIPMNSDRPLSFGHEGPPYNGWLYNGVLDEVRVWNVARSGPQIASAMAKHLAGTEAGLVGYWRFDEGSGDVAFDATSNHLDGQLGSAVGPDANDPQWTSNSAPVH